MLDKGELLFIGTTWAIEQPKESFERKKQCICASEKVSDGAVLPAHVQRRARDHSREPENDQSQSWDLQSTFLQLRERVPLHPAIP
jgi:hypothetical protein